MQTSVRSRTVRVVRPLDIPFDAARAALLDAEVTGPDAVATPDPTTIRWTATGDLFTVEPVRARVTDGVLELSASPARVPYFGWFFGPQIRRDLRRRLHHLASAVEAHGSGRPPPSSPKRAFWAPPESVSPAQAVTMATLGFVLAVTGYCGSLLTQLIDPIARAYDAPDFELGLLTGATRLGALVALVGSALADRRGRRRIILAATALACAATLLSAAAPEIWSFGALQVLVRGAVNLTTVVCFIAATEEAPEGARAWTLAVTGMAGTLGFVVAAALLPVTDLAPWAWRILFALGGVGLVLLPGIRRLLTETRRYMEIAARSSLRGRAREVVDAMYGGRFYVLAAALFLMNVFFAPSSQFMNRYLANERAFSGLGITALRATTQLFPALVAVYVGGRLAESRGRRPAAVGGVVVTAVASALFFTSGGPVLWTMLLVSTAAGALAGPSLAAFNTELFPTEVRGTAGAGLLLCAVAGSVTGLVAAGALSEPLGAIGPAVALTAFAPLVAAALLLPRLPEARGRELDEVSPPEV